MSRNIKALVVCTLVFTSSLAVTHIVRAQENRSSGDSSSANQSTSGAAPSKSTATNDEVTVLKKQLQLQKQEIDQLRDAMQKQQQLLQKLASSPRSKSPSGASAKASPTARKTSANSQAQTVQPLPLAGDTEQRNAIADATPPSVVSDSAPSPPSSAGSGQQQLNPAIPNAPEAPIPLRIGNAVLTPVGFVDATEFFRSENLGSGIGASFGSIPYSNTVAGQLTENRFTIQNSRIGLQFDDHFGENIVRGYWESDFLGAQPTNAFVTSNSDSLRIRLYWVDVQRGKFEFLAGQSWSLLTPSRVGISPMPSDIFYSQDMDTNYQVGLTWARQLGFRFVYHASPSVTAAIALEDADQYVGTAVVLPSNFSSSQVDTTASTSTPNVAPDVIGKLAFDPKVGGKDMHFEFAGLLSTFKTYNSTLNTKYTTEGGGGSFNFDLNLFGKFDLVGTSFYSSGGGRYIYGLAPDFIVQPNAAISPVLAASGIAGFEDQVTPKTMFYGYYGDTYIGRDYSVIPPTTTTTTTPTGTTTTTTPTMYVGYGYPAASSESSSQNRTIQEPTFGIIQTFWKSPRYGALQLITQYSYLTRAPWFVAPGSPRNAHLSEAYADIRYVLP
jgi:TolA-binding protein